MSMFCSKKLTTPAGYFRTVPAVYKACWSTRPDSRDALNAERLSSNRPSFAKRPIARNVARRATRCRFASLSLTEILATRRMGLLSV